MKKNRFIMKSALFALVLGFTFNIINASFTKMEDVQNVYISAIETLVGPNEASQDVIEKLNKEAVDKLHTLSEYKDAPYLINFYEESEEEIELYSNFVNLLNNISKSNNHNAVSLAGNKFADFCNILPYATTIEIVERPAILQFGEVRTSLIKGKPFFDATMKHLYLPKNALLSFKASEKYNELLSSYIEAKDQAHKLSDLFKEIRRIFPVFDKNPSLAQMHTDVTEDLTLLNGVKPEVKNLLVLLSYMDKIYSEYVGKKSVSVFTLGENFFPGDIIKEVVKQMDSPKTALVSVPSTDFGDFADIMAELNKAKLAPAAKPAAPALTKAPTAAKKPAAPAKSATVTVDEDKKVVEDLTTKTTDASGKVVEKQTKNTKVQTKKSTKKVDDKAAATTSPAADSDKDTPLTPADLEANYKELHDALQVGGDGWKHVHDACLADKTEFGKLYRSNTELQRPIREAIDQAATLKDFFEILKNNAKFAKILSEVKNDLLKEFMD